MRIAFPLLISAAVLSGCGPNLSPEQRAVRATNIAQTQAALETAQTVQVNGKSFRVAQVPERNQALVELVSSPTPYFAADIVAAAKAVTGCNGTFDAGVLALLGGDISTADLAEIRTKVSGSFSGWSVSLSC